MEVDNLVLMLNNAVVDLRILRENAIKIRQKLNTGVKFCAVVKANAYGHGAEEVARVLVDNGVKTLAIATLHEAIALREAGFVEQEIIMLGLTPDMYADTIVEYNITPVTCSYENAKAISEAAAKAGHGAF